VLGGFSYRTILELTACQEHGGMVVDLHKEKVGRIEDNELGDGFALIDPSQVWAPKLFNERRRVNPDTDATIHFINWGFANLCVERDEIVELGVARKLLTFTQTAGANGGWTMYFSGSIRDDEHMLRKNTRKVTVSLAVTMILSGCLSFVATRRTIGQEGALCNDRHCS
jgi:hypothetical protein